MKWKGCGRKWPLPNLRYYLCLSGRAGKPQKTLIRRLSLQTEIANHLTATFGISPVIKESGSLASQHLDLEVFFQWTLIHIFVAC
jgi:hypothetical protein